MDKKITRESGPFYGPFEGKKYAHLLCLLWVSHVYIDEKLQLKGVKKGILECSTMQCSICCKKGASFSCHNKKCDNYAHYRCAMLKGWYFDWNKFETFCPK